MKYRLKDTWKDLITEEEASRAGSISDIEDELLVLAMPIEEAIFTGCFDKDDDLAVEGTSAYIPKRLLLEVK